MARDKTRTKKYRTLAEDLDAEDLAKKRSIFGDTKAEDTKSRGAPDDEDSAGSQDDEDISMKKQGYDTVYDRNPLRWGAGSHKLQPILPRGSQGIFIRRRVMTHPMKRRNLKGRMQATMPLILTIVVTTETMIPPKTKKRK